MARYVGNCTAYDPLEAALGIDLDGNGVVGTRTGAAYAVPAAPLVPNAYPVRTIVRPIIQPLAQPVAQPLVQPFVQPIVQPIVQSIVQPVAQTLVRPIVQPVGPVYTISNVPTVSTVPIQTSVSTFPIQTYQPTQRFPAYMVPTNSGYIPYVRPFPFVLF
jgi:hypothetical protein